MRRACPPLAVLQAGLETGVQRLQLGAVVDAGGADQLQVEAGLRLAAGNQAELAAGAERAGGQLQQRRPVRQAAGQRVGAGQRQRGQIGLQVEPVAGRAGVEAQGQAGGVVQAAGETLFARRGVQRAAPVPALGLEAGVLQVADAHGQRTAQPHCAIRRLLELQTGEVGAQRVEAHGGRRTVQAAGGDLRAVGEAQAQGRRLPLSAQGQLGAGLVQRHVALAPLRQAGLQAQPVDRQLRRQALLRLPGGGQAQDPFALQREVVGQLRQRRGGGAEHLRQPGVQPGGRRARRQLQRAVQRAALGVGAQAGGDDEVRALVECEGQLQLGGLRAAAQRAGEQQAVFALVQLEPQAGRQQRGAGLLQREAAAQLAGGGGAGQAGVDAGDVQLARQPGEQADQRVGGGQAAGLAAGAGEHLPVQAEALHGEALEHGATPFERPVQLQRLGHQVQAPAIGGQLPQLQARQAQAGRRQLEPLPVQADDALLGLHALPQPGAVAAGAQCGGQHQQGAPAQETAPAARACRHREVLIADVLRQGCGALPGKASGGMRKVPELAVASVVHRGLC